MLPLRFNDRFRARLSPSASGRVRERALGPALAAAGALAPYRHHSEGIRHIARTENDTVRKMPEATRPDSNGNLEMIPLQKTDEHVIMQSEKKELTERLEDERCPL